MEQRAAHVIDRLYSQLGKRIFFPSGIVAQAEQSANASIQATAGMAYENKTLSSLPEVRNILQNFTVEEAIRYAPVAGLPALRAAWKERIQKLHPTLREACITHPIVTSGLTHGISSVLHLMLDPQDSLVTPDSYWENYEHIANTILGASIEVFPMFNDALAFNIDGLEDILRRHLLTKKKTVIILNFPNNPTGYSIKKDEATCLIALLYKYADLDLPILTVIDDAYFGLFYGEDIYKESLFAALSQLHKNIVAVKIDGATKEFLMWGVRVGFVTFGCKEWDNTLKTELEKKLVAKIRGTVTSASTLSQSIVLRALRTPTIEDSICAHQKLLQSRFAILQRVIQATTKKYLDIDIYPLPCNSGYFISFACPSAEYSNELRLEILEKEKIALITIQDKLRFTFSSVTEEEIPVVVDVIYKYASLKRK